MTVETGEFFIKSGNSGFRNRQKSIFDQIAVEEEHVNLPKNQPEAMEVEEADRRAVKRNRRATRSLRGQESLFKAPSSPPPRKRFIPDFQRNPHRWTKYTLADVPASDMTDASNTAAALSFLRTVRRSPDPPGSQTLHFTSKAKRMLRSRRADEEVDDEIEKRTSKSSQPAGFGDPCCPIEDEPAPDKPTFVNGKLTMPEYVIGERFSKLKKNSSKPKSVGKQMKLSHLFEQDDE